MQTSVTFAKGMICVLNTVTKNCPFLDVGLNTEEKAYQKGRMDLLCSLAAYKIISLKTAAYMAGLSEESFENRIQYWRDEQKME